MKIINLIKKTAIDLWKRIRSIPFKQYFWQAIDTIKKTAKDLRAKLPLCLIKGHLKKVWTVHLTENAKTYIGMFAGLKRIADGSAKKPEKIIKEWCTRTRYNFEDSYVNELCQKRLAPLCEDVKGKDIKKWAVLLLQAAKSAGITKDTEKSLILTENNVNAYIEWDGEELYEGDTIEVMFPAWYQNGEVLEQGNCKKISE